jgi:hypothetical protein
MPIVIFLIGIAVRQRHHSQVRKDPWTTFFNGDCASNKLIGRYPPDRRH